MRPALVIRRYVLFASLLFGPTTDAEEGRSNCQSLSSLKPCRIGIRDSFMVDTFASNLSWLLPFLSSIVNIT